MIWESIPHNSNVAAFIMRIGFWGPVCYNYNKEYQKNSIGNYLGPYIRGLC